MMITCSMLPRARHGGGVRWLESGPLGSIISGDAR